MIFVGQRNPKGGISSRMPRGRAKYSNGEGVQWVPCERLSLPGNIGGEDRYDGQN